MEELKKDNKNEFDHAFTPVIFEIVKAIKNAEDNSKLKKELKATLKVIIQKYTNFETQMVSEKAYCLIMKHNEENITNYNPFNLNFDQHRNKFGKIKDNKSNKKHNTIMWEHVIPISNTINEFEQENKYNNIEEVLKYLKEYPGTCLITREEDDDLNKNYKTNRTKETWKNIYEEEVKIKIKKRF